MMHVKSAHFLGVGMDGARVLLAVEDTSDVVLVALTIFLSVPLACHCLEMLQGGVDAVNLSLIGRRPQVILAAVDTLDAHC